MKSQASLRFSKSTIKDMEIIAKYHGIKTSDWLRRLDNNFSNFVKRKKTSVIRQLEGMWILDKITDSDFKRLTRMDIPKQLLGEKISYKRDSKLYKENARKALLMNF